MKSTFWGNFLFALFTGIYFIVLFQFIKYLFARLPVNFALDLLSIVMCILAFVVSVGAADKTVGFIKEHL